VIQPNDIHTLTDFKRNTDGLVERIARSGRPHVLTVEGSPRFVVQDADAFQRLMEELSDLRARFSARPARAAATTTGRRR